MSLTNRADREPPAPATIFGFPVRLELELEPGLVVIVNGADALVFRDGYSRAELNLDAILDAVNDARMRRALSRARVRLELDEQEAAEVHHALGVVVQLLAEVEPGQGAALTQAAGPRLLRVARRLSHERRHRGAIPNPNGP